jgi:hypothetical protein
MENTVQSWHRRLLDHFIRPRQHARRDRQADLFRFEYLGYRDSACAYKSSSCSGLCAQAFDRNAWNQCLGKKPMGIASLHPSYEDRIEKLPSVKTL